MYSIFSTKGKRQNHLEEGEPPPKKNLSEKDILIKKLAENQLTTRITLTEQLNKKKEFTSSESFTNITSLISGKTALKDFQKKLADVDEFNSFKSNGLSDEDIKIYQEYTKLGEEFWLKYKNVNEHILQQRIDNIRAVAAITIRNDCDSRDSKDISEIQKVNQNFSTLNTPLKLTAQQIEQRMDILPSPMDELPNMEKQFMDNLEYSICDIKKIRKKARSMGKKVNNLETLTNLVSTEEYKQVTTKNKNVQRPTQWDMKETPSHLQKTLEIIDKDKVYDCKRQTWYTIKHGKIMKIADGNKASPKNAEPNNEKLKMTIDEIKNIPKFSCYSPGVPTKVLYIKNLGKNVTELCLKNLLTQFREQDYSIKVMGGRMKGQAFIHFQDSNEALKALDTLNGVVLERKPIIVQFGKNNT